MHRTIQLVRKICYLKLAVIGVPVNVLAIVVLSQGKCGLSPCITLYLVAMAAADLLAIITDVILHRINDYYFPLNFLSITPVCSVRYVLLRAAIDCSVWFTVSFTFDRFGAICYQKLKTRYCTKKTAAVVLATTGTLLCLKNIPIYFRFKPKVIIDNVPFSCSNKQSYFTDPRWIGFRRFEKVLTPLIPFGLILFLNILTVKHIFKVSRIRKGLKCQNKALDHSDPEMGNRRKSVILLFSISGSFILLWQGCPEAWYIGETEQRLRQRMNGHRTTINRQEGSLPVGEHFSGPGHSTSDLRVTILQGGLQDRQQRKVAEQRLIAKSHWAPARLSIEFPAGQWNSDMSTITGSKILVTPSLRQPQGNRLTSGEGPQYLQKITKIHLNDDSGQDSEHPGTEYIESDQSESQGYPSDNESPPPDNPRRW
ncbi:uncharacterized protein [Chiloscyllium punctatum]|uniref:uncharacterized protein n=1 Tax=Chiloscyllium punctatum TaxID=137246 RepID=UPI003B639835